MTNHVISRPRELAFLGLQMFNVAFLLLHDWIPLGRLNNLSAIRSQDKLSRSIFVTVLPVVPAAVCLFYSAKYFVQPYPDWVAMWLWITYGALVFGLLRAWWVPYLIVPDMERAARYRIIFAGTHSFLPQRNGMAPDTLHTVFHLAAAATLLLLLMR
ncbi:MAG: hypothetical protein WAK29_17480 [Terriglobales bacterium]